MGVGRPFTAEQLGQVRAVLQGQLAEAYANSPRSNIVISFDAPVGSILNYHVKAEWWTPVCGRWRIKRPIPRRIACSTSAEEPGATPLPWHGAATRSMWWR